MQKRLHIFIFLCMCQIGYTAQCTMTLVKASCWKDFDVTMNVYSSENDKLLVSVSAPKSTSFGRATFECKPMQSLSMTSTYSPVIWDADKGKVYKAIRFWVLPREEPPEGTIWEVKVCFPKQFSDVPLPQGDVNNCTCDMSALPPLKPNKT